MPALAADKEKLLYAFPPPPTPDAVEWPGSPLGAFNLITRTKGRTQVHDKTTDAKPGKRDALVASAQRAIYRSFPNTILEHDVVIHGVRVRAITNSPHLYDFWVDNWYSVREWETLTGQVPPHEPKIMVYALGGVSEEPEAAYYSRQTNTIIFFNTSYYGQLKSWVLGAVGRILAEEEGIHSIHGACVERNGKGILYIAPTGTGKSTSSYGLMNAGNCRFHSDDWVYVRYAGHLRDGSLFVPMRILEEKRKVAEGFAVYRWLEANGKTKSDATLEGVDLQNKVKRIRVGDLDFSRPLEAYAYTSEKVFYLRSNLVESFPEVAYHILHSKIENGPDATLDFVADQKSKIEGLYAQLERAQNPTVRRYFAQIDPARVKETLARLYAFDNTRAMLDIARVFGPGNIFANPLEPVHLTTVMLLKRDFGDPLVLDWLSLDEFMTWLLIGETPDKKREIAFNAYRAVDDETEKKFLVKVQEANGGGIDPNFYGTYVSQPNIPPTLLQEFELFRVMYQATNCYVMNTVLQKDPKIKGKQEAVQRSMALIARTIDRQPKDVHLTLENYVDFLA